MPPLHDHPDMHGIRQADLVQSKSSLAHAETVYDEAILIEGVPHHNKLQERRDSLKHVELVGPRPPTLAHGLTWRPGPAHARRA